MKIATVDDDVIEDGATYDAFNMESSAMRDNCEASNKSIAKITVITATWNSAQTIQDCLDSVKRQSYQNAEHIVVDGASTDGTVECIEANIESISRFVSERDEGIYDALNKGLKLATGEIVGFLHADDIYQDEDVLARVAQAFEDPAVCAVYGDLDYVLRDNPSKIIRRWRSEPYRPGMLSWGWMPPHPTLYVRREWYERIGFFDTRLKIAADYLSILRLFSNPQFHTAYLPNVLVKMRLGGESNKSLSNIYRKSKEDLNALRESGVGGVGALAWKNISKVGQFIR